MSNQVMVQRRCLGELLNLADDPRMKAIVGPAYSGKTVLLRQVQGGLLSHGVSDTCIAKVSFDKGMNQVDNPEEFLRILEQSCDFEKGYLLIDSIHLVPDYAYMMNMFRLRHPLISVYMTLSLNSMWVGTDSLKFIPNEDLVVIHLYPFTFREFLSRFPGDRYSVFQDFISSGGLPFLRPGMSFDDRVFAVEGYMHIILNRLILKETKCNPLGMAQMMNYILVNVGTPLTQKEIVSKSGVADNRTLEKYIDRFVESGILFRLKGYQMDRAMKESTKFPFFAMDTLTGGFLNMKGLQTLPVSVVVMNIVFIELTVRGYSPCVLMSKGESVGFGVEKEGSTFLIRVVQHADTDRGTDAFASYRSSTLPKMYLSLDRDIEDATRLNHTNIVDFLLSDKF